jgi:His/Glu/Gln/Arg/opine family amino acid ABC transporter permease subunit
MPVSAPNKPVVTRFAWLFTSLVFASICVSAEPTAYIELIRGTPLLIQLLFIFYGLPNVGIRLSPFVASVVRLGLNYAASEAEIYRAGILSVPAGQWHAAFALGLARMSAFTSDHHAPGGATDSSAENLRFQGFR